MSTYPEPIRPGSLIEKLAKIAYAAYGKTTDYKNYQGLPMPSWDELPVMIKTAWMEATAAVVEAFDSR